MFCGEMNSLNAFRQTATIYVPEPLCVVADPKGVGGALVLEYLEMTPVTEWTKLGSQLADLHLFNAVLEKKKAKLEGWVGRPPKDEDAVPDTDMTIEKEIKLQLSDETVFQMETVEQFGFDGPTYCGSIQQNNEWHDDWVQFYARNKLDPQIRLLLENTGDRELSEYWSELQLKVDRPFRNMRLPIKPALLHGDLWSGNVAQVEDRPVLYDPASFYGHSEFDLSLSHLFGGFERPFFEEYFRKIPKDHGFEM